MDDSRWAAVIAAGERLAAARTMDDIIGVLRETARHAVDADGIAVVLREGNQCHYVAEDAMSPLWSGQRFALDDCVSGWAMRHEQTVVIPDIYQDDRIPYEAYRSTFVNSLVMVPIGRPHPIAALGAYWQAVRVHPSAVIRRTEALARLAALAIENVRLLNRLKETNEQRELAVVAGMMSVWSLDPETGVLTASAPCLTAFGLSEDGGSTFRDLEAVVHPEDRSTLLDAYRQALETLGGLHVEARMLTEAGETRWIDLRARLLLDERGRPKLLTGVALDVTDRKAAETRLKALASALEERVEQRSRELFQAQEALRQSQKLEAIGQLTGGVAHDFNNLLTPILGGLGMLRRSTTVTDREQRLIDGAYRSAERAKSLVQRLLAFARRQPLEPAPVDIGLLLNEMTPLLQITLGANVRFDLQVCEALPPALADRNQVELAILNLVVNARDAMPDGGSMTIDVATDSIDGHAYVDGAGSAERDRPSSLAPGTYVRITLTDSGAGMDAETLRRAVEPFFSTKGVGKGTGLGLSMVHGLASQLGGAMSLSSESGRGTRVRIWMPSCEPGGREDAPERDATSAPRQGVALLVDDEELVRGVVADMLHELGYEVVQAASAADALRCLASDPRISILVSDQMMPNKTGLELAREVLMNDPAMTVLLISGYMDMLNVPPDIRRLFKPFSQEELGQGIVQAQRLAEQRGAAARVARLDLGARR